MESSGYKGDGEPSTKEWNLPMINMTIIATKLTAAKANNAKAFFLMDLILLSSLTFLNKAWNNNMPQIDIKQERIKGRDLVISLMAASGEPLTMEPTKSANAYSALKNVNAEKMNKTIRTIETRRDCLLCALSKDERTKLSLLKNFFISISPMRQSRRPFFHLNISVLNRTYLRYCFLHQ